mmetsp:Transcript_10578/g.47699  ORF Transcript_10578/g.47699 Transcript_10578/m.47699 type:complete len:245 (+) Transcript_10578:835-1569(+)
MRGEIRLKNVPVRRRTCTRPSSRPLAPLRVLAALLVEHALRGLVALARRARLRLRRRIPPPPSRVVVVVVAIVAVSPSPSPGRHPGAHVLRVRLLLLPPRVRVPGRLRIVSVRRVERVHLVPGSNPGCAAAELVDGVAQRGFGAELFAPLHLLDRRTSRWTRPEALVVVGVARAAGPGLAPRVELAHARRARLRGALRDGRWGLPGVVSSVRARPGASQASGDCDVVRGAVSGEVRGGIAASVR